MLLRMKELNRLKVIQGYMDGRIEIEEALRILKRRPRSVYRMVAKLRAKGPEGVLHGNRNKVSPRRVPNSIRKMVIALALGRYRDINDTHLCEILSKAEGIVMGRESLRGILRKEGIPLKRKVKRRRFRSRRERKEAFGMMLQVDASPHDWLEGRGPMADSGGWQGRCHGLRLGPLGRGGNHLGLLGSHAGGDHHSWDSA